MNPEVHNLCDSAESFSQRFGEVCEITALANTGLTPLFSFSETLPCVRSQGPCHLIHI
jgi:hypothetical protein